MAAYAQLVIAVGDGAHVAQATQEEVAERAGVEDLGGLHQGHLDGRVGALEVLGSGGAPEAPADHHHAAGVLVADGEGGNTAQQGQGGGGADALQEAAPGDAAAMAVLAHGLALRVRRWWRSDRPAPRAPRR